MKVEGFCPIKKQLKRFVLLQTPYIDPEKDVLFRFKEGNGLLKRHCFEFLQDTCFIPIKISFYEYKDNIIGVSTINNSFIKLQFPFCKRTLYFNIKADELYGN